VFPAVGDKMIFAEAVGNNEQGGGFGKVFGVFKKVYAGL
jgi:hypothetical protein